MTMFVGKAGVTTVQAVVLKSHIDLYRKCKMLPTRGVTIKSMMQKAAEITGKQFKPRDYGAAVEALQVWIEEHGTTGQDQPLAPPENPDA